MKNIQFQDCPDYYMNLYYWLLEGDESIRIGIPPCDLEEYLYFIHRFSKLYKGTCKIYIFYDVFKEGIDKVSNWKEKLAKFDENKFNLDVSYQIYTTIPLRATKRDDVEFYLTNLNHVGISVYDSTTHSKDHNVVLYDLKHQITFHIGSSKLRAVNAPKKIFFGRFF